MEQFVVSEHSLARDDTEDNMCGSQYANDDFHDLPESMDMLDPSHRSEVVDFARGIAEIASGLQDIMASARAAER